MGMRILYNIVVRIKEDDVLGVYNIVFCRYLYVRFFFLDYVDRVRIL